MRILLAIPFLATFGLSACSGETDLTQKHQLAPGEEVKFEIAIDRPMYVGFEFELGSDSWKATKECPEVEGTVKDFMIKACGAIHNLDDAENKVMAQNGAGMNFQPTDGKLRMKLVNMAKRTMDFELNIKEAKQ